jgi:hypothetical protein
MIRCSAIAIFVLTGVAVMQPAWAVPGYKLYQTSDFYGESIAEVSTQSMRLQSSRLALKLHVAKPDYGMTAINDRNKQFARIPLSKWTGFIEDRGGPAISKDVVKRATTKICGIPVDEYWVNAPRRDRVTNKNAKDLYYNGRAYNTHYWVAGQIHPPEKSYEIFSSALGMPASLGFPVKMIQYNGDGRAFTTFDTKRIERGDVSDKLPVPAGYKKASDEMALLVGGADTSKIAELLGDDEDLLSTKPNTKAAPGAKKIASRQHIRGWVPGMDLSTTDVAPKVPKRLRGAWTPGG